MEEMKYSGNPILGDVPISFKVIRLKFLLSQNDGGLWGDDPLANGDNSLVLRSTEQTIDGKWIIVNPAERFLGNLKSKEYYKIKKDDLLITKSSGSKLHIGKTTIANEEIERNNFFYSNFLQRLHVSNGLYPNFLWWILNNKYSRDQFVYMQNSTSGIGNINAENINNLVIALPSYEEQKDITIFLNKKCDEIDEITKTIEEEIETLEEYKKSIISEYVTKGLNPNVQFKESGIPWIGKIPEKWQIIKIKDGFTEKKSKAYEEDPIVLSLARSGVKVRDISNNEGQLAASYFEYNPVDIDDLLLNPMDLYSGANCSISQVKGVISPAYINLKYKNGINPKYYDFYFKLCYWSFAFFSYGKGVSFDNRWTLNRETLFSIEMPLPSLQEQNEIADCVEKKCSKIDEFINNKNEQLEVLLEYKKSLIYEYTTGKKRVY